ncbi:hypothetical protein SAMN05444680_102663 [Variovorax sp. YR216]|nr:hypothetical protein SAMN05444680_102663 [Variovorax sp. YR216]
MPELQVTLTDAERELFERVRVQQGLASIDQVVEWLAKSRLRQLVRQGTGSPRALHLVPRNQPRDEA